VAILAVLVFHGMMAGRPAVGRAADGWALLGHDGVTLFFVLSGYLITGILMDTSSAPAAAYYGRFYARRVRRIAPTYLVTLVVALVVLPSVFPDRPAFAVPAGSAVWALTFLSNFAIARWGWAALPLVLGPLWSLAVEEQFYLFWPWLLRRRAAASILALCAGAVVVSIATRFACLRYAPSGWLWEYATPACIDALAAGAVVAVFARTSVAGLGRWSVRVGVVCVAIWLVCPFLGSAGAAVRQTALVGAFAAWLARVVTAPSGWSASVLSTPPLRFFGRYSYAMYLFNQPVVLVMLVFVHAGVVTHLVMSVVLTTAAAVVNWYAYERRALTTPFAFSFSESPSR
jgi:peptidoglycan/LPS O-acetylase OafA/YrhL